MWAAEAFDEPALDAARARVPVRQQTFRLSCRSAIRARTGRMIIPPLGQASVDYLEQALRSPRMRFESRSIEPPFIPLDEFFALDKHRPQDAAAHRRFGVDPNAARFFGWTVKQAESAPDSHYDDVIRRFASEWDDGTRFSLVIRSRLEGEAVGTVELRPVGDEADVSFMVSAELRGHGLAPRALNALLAWGSREIGLRHANLGCHVDNTASRRVAEKCGFVFVCRQDDELRFRAYCDGSRDVTGRRRRSVE